MLRRLMTLITVYLLAFWAASAHAEVSVSQAFGDHMVLQRDMAVPIWGTAVAGEKVLVTFRDQKKETTADKDGKWSVRLDALKLGKPAELTISGKNSITIKDVLVGDVWVGSGQSNMAGGNEAVFHDVPL